MSATQSAPPAVLQPSTPGGALSPSALDAGVDAWPNTSRVLPWMLAGFIALLWLVPFNSILLNIPAPIDLHLDRLVLPAIVFVWGLALIVDGFDGPRISWSPIHTAIAVFLAVAFVSVLVNADYLNQTLELSTAIKKLSLLVFYGLVFMIFASAVRDGEVRAFMKYILVLAVLCALGIIWEYRFHYNVFYSGSDALLPNIFQVQLVDPAAVDEIGRIQTRGPAQLGLEAAAMLIMALPIAIVGVMESRRWRTRLAYGLAGCILLAAAVSTYRKTGLIAPIAVLVTLAWFRPRELFKLAPLGVVALLAIHALSPGALGSSVGQLSGGRLSGAGTVNDRTSDYDAIRPDVWSRPALGRGYGSYEQAQYRILDSEILHRTVEMGVIGLVAYLFMPVSVLLAMGRLVRLRDRLRSPPALVAACAAAVFLTVSAFFDAMSFPHVPYIFMTFAGLAAVLYTASREPT